jgi:hypothetical protein
MSKPGKSSNLLLVFLAIAAIALIAVLMWSNKRPSQTNSVSSNTSPVNQANVVDSQPNNTNATSQTEPEVGVVTLKSAETKTIGDIITYKFGSSNILNVIPLQMKSAILAETAVLDTAPVTVAGQSGEKLTLSSAKDGSKLTIVQITIGDKLYDFRGSDDFLNNLDQYVSFNKN